MNKTWLDDLCKLIATETKGYATDDSAKRYLVGLYKVILNQLKVNGKIQIPKFGTFILIKKEGRERKVGDPVNGGVKYIYVKPRYYIEFKPSSALERNINENHFNMRNKKSKTLKEVPSTPPIEQTVADIFTKATERQKSSEANSIRLREEFFRKYESEKLNGKAND